MNSTKVSVKHRTRNDGKPVLCEYQPLQGFYDLRNWDIPKKDFLKLWSIQRYLFQCEQNEQRITSTPLFAIQCYLSLQF